MAEFDLSAERAKRKREDRTLIMRGDNGEILAKYDLAPEFPIEALDLGVEGKLGAAWRALFVDPAEADEFMQRFKPSLDDLMAVMRGFYGLSGEA